MAKTVVLDQDECIGCGSCEELCPDVFAMDEETELAHVLKPQGGDEACIDEAIETCPVDCIEWQE
jgi:ferredoxin